MLLTLFVALPGLMGQRENNPVKLIVRGDDMASFHAANVACIESYRNGVMTSVEIMVPCPWFPEAVQMLRENPGLDVGVHLTMTSEWDNIKWRPLTGISSLTDEHGYFFPMVWPNEKFPPEETFRESDWNMEDLEAELRAQIELAMKTIDNLSHLTTHMGFGSADPTIDKLVSRLAKEYDLDVDLSGFNVKRFPYRSDKSLSIEQQSVQFAKTILDLDEGYYLYVEHPALDTPEMETVGIRGNYVTGAEREIVTQILTSEVVKEAIRERGVELVSYGDLKRLEKGN
jgi:hypothetical protein